MSTQQNHLAKQSMGLLSAIAASSLLGLPALAGGLTGGVTQTGGQAQTSPDQMQCTPMTQSNSSSSTATPEASAIGAAQLPNQADPRTGIASSNQTVSARPDRSASDKSSVQAIDPADTRSERRAYGDVLAQGGATAGGFASQQVAAANNPEAHRIVSSRYSSNEPRANYANGGAAMTDNMSAPTHSASMNSDSMRSNTMSQPSSQSSRMMAGTTIAQCPSGKMPGSVTPESRQKPDRMNPGAQLSPQSDPQMRQSPADDNGSRAR